MAVYLVLTEVNSGRLDVEAAGIGAAPAAAASAPDSGEDAAPTAPCTVDWIVYQINYRLVTN